MKCIVAVALTALTLASCGGGGGGALTLPAAASVPTGPRRVAVVGDSISKLQVLPDSAVPCGYPTGNATPCDYSTDGSKAWPAALANAGGYAVTNLAVPGARVVQDIVGTVSVMHQIPGIPANAQFVILEAGTNDTSANGAGAEYLQWIQQAVAAIHAQAPSARIVFVGVRYYYGSDHARVDLWNQDLATEGSTISLTSEWPAGVGIDWPDGTHPGPSAVAKLASIVSSALSCVFMN